MRLRPHERRRASHRAGEPSHRRAAGHRRRAPGGGAGSPPRAPGQAAAAGRSAPLCRALSRPGDRRARARSGRRAGDAGGAARGAPHDRFRLLARGPRPDRQLFRRDDRGRGRARAGERRALLPRDHARRAHRRRPAQRRVRPSHRALGRLLRPGQDRRAGVAAHRRHHPDQGRGRLLGLGRAAQPRAVLRRRRHDGGHEPAALGFRARRHPGDRAAALRLRPRGAAALARRAGHAGRRLRLCRRADRRGAHAAGLHQRDAGDAAASPARSSAPSTPRCNSIRRARDADRDRDLPGVLAASSWCCGSARRT